MAHFRDLAVRKGGLIQFILLIVAVLSQREVCGLRGFMRAVLAELGRQQPTRNTMSVHGNWVWWKTRQLHLKLLLRTTKKTKGK